MDRSGKSTLIQAATFQYSNRFPKIHDKICCLDCGEISIYFWYLFFCPGKQLVCGHICWACTVDRGVHPLHTQQMASGSTGGSCSSTWLCKHSYHELCLTALSFIFFLLLLFTSLNIQILTIDLALSHPTEVIRCLHTRGGILKLLTQL